MSSMLALHGGTPVRSNPLPKTWPVAGERELVLLRSILDDGSWYEIIGPKTEELEQELADYHGLSHAIAVSSGLDAINISLRALDIGPGDEVIMPGYTCIADGIAALQANAVPVFADIEPETWCLAPDGFSAAIGPRTRAVVPVHFAGNVADMRAISRIALDRGIAVVEDAALAQGATRFGKSVGSWGDLTILSFGEDKPMTAGRGGMILTGNAGLAETCRALRDRGRVSKDFYGAWGQRLGGNFFPGELLCTILLGQFERYAQQIAVQETNTRYLLSLLEGADEIWPITRMYSGERNVVNMLMLQIDRETLGIGGRRFAEALQAEGIRCSFGYIEPLNRHPVMQSQSVRRCPLSCAYGLGREIDYAGLRLPVCEDACASGLWLWQDVLVNDRDVMNDVAEAILKVVAYADEL